MATKKKPQKGRRAPFISVTIQRRPKRRSKLLRGAKSLFKALVKGEPTVKYKGDDKPSSRSPKSKSVSGGGRPIRAAGWQGPDPYESGAVWDDRWEDPRDVDEFADDIEGDVELDDVETRATPSSCSTTTTPSRRRHGDTCPDAT
jgi:hypothetical protein